MDRQKEFELHLVISYNHLQLFIQFQLIIIIINHHHHHHLI